MIKAVLFDLDNTLILFDEQEFLKAYMPRVARAFADLMPPDRFRDSILKATRALMTNDGRMSNAEYFMRNLSESFEVGPEVLWDRFLAFYDAHFDEFRNITTVLPEARDIVLDMKNQGLRVVIASNPFWPLSVQNKRLVWAGLGGIEFDHITHIENTSFLKPRPGYYREICHAIDVEPERCLMVGNDPVNDMAAAIIGMKTYHTTDSRPVDASLAMSRKIGEGASGNIPEPDFTGPLRRVPDAVRSLLVT